jgi:hypothetical protein
LGGKSGFVLESFKFRDTHTRLKSQVLSDGEAGLETADYVAVFGALRAPTAMFFEQTIWNLKDCSARGAAPPARMGAILGRIEPQSQSRILEPPQKRIVARLIFFKCTGGSWG